MKLLRADLKRFLCPEAKAITQGRRALDSLWNVSEQSAPILSARYMVNWELPSYMRAFFPNGQRLGDVMTLSGDAKNAWATSCREYLASTWEDIGLLLLEVIEEMLRAPSIGMSKW